MELFDFMTKPRDLKDILSENKYKSIYDDAQKLFERLPKAQSDEVLTASRTLIETTCKTLLDHLAIAYDNREDLPRFSKRLNIALDLHVQSKTEKSLKQILCGVVSIIYGVTTIRNEHGDAHGKSHNSEELPFFHAELIAYLACGLTRYYIEAYESKVSRKTFSNLADSEREVLIDIWLEAGKRHNISNPERLPYTEMLEEIAIEFTQQTEIVLARKDIFWGLSLLRKQTKLPKPEVSKEKK